MIPTIAVIKRREIIPASVFYRSGICICFIIIVFIEIIQCWYLVIQKFLIQLVIRQIFILCLSFFFQIYIVTALKPLFPDFAYDGPRTIFQRSHHDFFLVLLYDFKNGAIKSFIGLYCPFHLIFASTLQRYRIVFLPRHSLYTVLVYTELWR